MAGLAAFFSDTFASLIVAALLLTGSAASAAAETPAGHGIL